MESIFSVSQVNLAIKELIAQDKQLGLIYIKVEISNVTYHSSGTIYFTLKDTKSQLSCVMFSSYQSLGLKFRLTTGLKVVITGSIEVYERDGKYQLYAKKIVKEGLGELYERFEALKNELEERGMFDPMYKKAIPSFAKRLGIVTAPTGAAVQDIINVSKRRYPGIEIILYPAIVQGEQAPASIIRGIRMLDSMDVDVIIVGRGGGSIEDLWGFNDEKVAEAVFNCDTPIISAVGHQTDYTIVDYVADLRAPTPSAAAELAVFDMGVLASSIADYRNRLSKGFERVLDDKRNVLEKKWLRLKALSPEKGVLDKRQRLDMCEERIRRAMDAILEEKHHSIRLYAERMRGLSPLLKLSQGYSHVADCDGKTVTDINAVEVNDKLNIHVKNGTIIARVEATKSN